MTELADKMHALHRGLRSASVPHAFGGALALAWCLPEARATQDIDVNVFVPESDCDATLAALPESVEVTEQNRLEILRDGQSRLRWDEVPLDLFFNTTGFHEAAALRVRWDTLGDAQLPFLDCGDLAVFKAFFNRSKDWTDLSAMLHAGTLDVAAVVGVLAEYLGSDDERIDRLRNLRPEPWS